MIYRFNNQQNCIYQTYRNGEERCITTLIKKNKKNTNEYLDISSHILYLAGYLIGPHIKI